MLKFLSGRETGIDEPLLFRRAEITRRAYGLELSKHRDVERVHSGGINCLDIDLVENRYLLSGAIDGVIIIHDLFNNTGEVKYTSKKVCDILKSNRHAHKSSVETVQWYPLDTGMFTSSGTDRQLKIWDTNFLVTADTFSFNGIVYSHHISQVATRHSLIAVGCQGATVKLCDLKSGSSSHQLVGHKKSVYCVQWSPKDEFLLATGSADQRVYLWDIRSAKGYLRSLDQHNGALFGNKRSMATAHDGQVNGMQFTDDGLHLLTFGTDNRLRMWNVTTGKNMLVNYGCIDNECKKTVKCCISSGGSPDLIYVPNEMNIDIFHLYEGQKLDTLRGHYSQVNTCVFHKDYQEMYSGGNDRNILVWVPESDGLYDEHLSSLSKQKSTGTKLNVTATVDTWSDDDD